eukprot:TRINITY_DN10630_c0_g1_i1.p2 TRINITY_DN10630_c0_g1~~TRINITY_DN10630_c0_g1_i1.p2  ORF type:complete len:122 (+),score=31.92 TRINITY_DN10630_c0_g1_i1:69-434(+)
MASSSSSSSSSSLSSSSLSPSPFANPVPPAVWVPYKIEGCSYSGLYCAEQPNLLRQIRAHEDYTIVADGMESIARAFEEFENVFISYRHNNTTVACQVVGNMAFPNTTMLYTVDDPSSRHA